MTDDSIQRFLWRVTPLSTPRVTRRCSKCGCQTSFQSSDKFRVNANKRRLDVWLVYKCEKCDTTWNLTLFTRVNPDQLDPALYLGFEKNDAALAWRYSFNAEILMRAAAVVDFDAVDFDVDGEMATFADAPVQMEIVADYAIPVRLDKIIMRMTGLSRSKLKALSEKGKLKLSTGADIHKAKFDGHMYVTYVPGEQ